MANADEKSTDLVASDKVEYSPEVLALLAQQEQAVAESSSLQVPIVKITQSMTKEVKSGDAEPGEFFNSLTSEGYGNKVEVIVCHFAEGRAYSDDDGNYRNAIGVDEIPESWASLKGIGEESVGLRFDEHPDAYEQYSARERRGEIEWKSGPPIFNTYNYTVLILLTDEDGNEELMPGRISFARTTTDAHKKISTIKQSLLRNKAYWDVTFELETTEERKGKNDYYVVKVKKGRPTRGEERLRAAELALASDRGHLIEAGDADEGGTSKRSAPVETGGMAV